MLVDEVTATGGLPDRTDADGSRVSVPLPLPGLLVSTWIDFAKESVMGVVAG